MLIFVAGFRFLFGHENAAVGLTFFSALVIISRFDQMRVTPLRDGIGIVIVSCFIGTASFFAGLNPYAGLAINLISLFCLVYFLFGTFQNQLYSPAMIGYLYLLNSPEAMAHITDRIVAIAAGTIILIAALFALQRSRKSHTIRAQFQHMLGLVANKARELAGTVSDDYTYTSTEEIREALHALFALIYRTQKNNHATRVLDEMRISFALALERFVVVIQQIKHSRPATAEEQAMLTELAELLDVINAHVSDFASFGTIIQGLNAFVEKYSRLENMSIEMYELLETCSLASHQLKAIGQAGQNPNQQRINTKKSQWMSEVGQALKPDKLRLNFALKLSITVSLLLFITHITGVKNGQWLAYTVAFLLRPYVEDTRNRSRERAKGTVIATVIFMIVFGFVDSTWLQLTLVMVADIIYSRAKSARAFQVTCTSFAALGSMAIISGDYSSLGIERLIYVAIGVGISILVSHYIAPYHIVSDTAKLLTKYRQTTYDLLHIFLYSRLREEMPAILKDQSIAAANDHRSLNIVFKGLLMNASLIEQQVTFNNRRLHCPAINNFFIIEHQLVNDVYFLFSTLSTHMAHSEEFVYLLHELAHLTQAYQNTPPQDIYKNETLMDKTEELLTAIEAAFGFCEQKPEKMALITLESTIKEMRQQLEFDLTADALTNS